VCSAWVGPLAGAAPRRRAFVVYGSLVPLEFRPLPPGEAWARFQQIPFLRLGVESRADWIANGVLYAPLGFLGTLVLLQRGWWRLVAGIVAVGAACGLAVAVEYAQLFFPPRTVSLNDLLAEGIGSAVGSVVAIAVWSMRARWQPLQQAGAGWLHHRALPLYAVAYLAYSLFPYDFLISGTELSEKLASDMWGWWLAAATDGRSSPWRGSASNSCWPHRSVPGWRRGARPGRCDHRPRSAPASRSDCPSNSRSCCSPPASRRARRCWRAPPA
jgi:hypothetical protein